MIVLQKAFLSLKKKLNSYKYQRIQVLRESWLNIYMNAIIV